MEEMEMTGAFWQGKRVFLTGHTGFKGSWLSLWLQKLGAELTGYALDPPTTPSLFEIARVGEGMNSFVADIRDADRLKREMTSAKPDVVIHMAAQALVRRSYTDPIETYSTNVMGTVNLLEAVRQVPGIRAVLNVTTDKCYENREWVWGYREIEPMGGFDPYSNSKACSELVTASYRSSFFPAEKYAQHGVGLASARAGNVIGGGDWAKDRLVPDVIRAFQAKDTLQIRSPDAIRPWQHVLEPLHGYLMLAEKLYLEGPPWAEAWNFGPYEQDHQPVAAVVRYIAEKWHDKSDWSVDAGPHPHEANYLRLDCAKARNRLGWYPRWRFEQALDAILEWHRAQVANEDARSVTLRQIKNFLA